MTVCRHMITISSIGLIKWMQEKGTRSNDSREFSYFKEENKFFDQFMCRTKQNCLKLSQYFDYVNVCFGLNVTLGNGDCVFKKADKRQSAEYSTIFRATGT